MSNKNDAEPDDNPANNAATVRLQPQNAAVQGQLIAQKPTQQNPVVIQKIVPTLTEDIILLELESIVNKTVNFEAINAMGQTVFSETTGIEKGHNKVSFDVTRLPQGIYFIQIDVGKGRNVPTKFVKL